MSRPPAVALHARDRHPEGTHGRGRLVRDGNRAFDGDGLVHTRIASINDLPIVEAERLFHWPAGRRPDGHPGLTELGL